MDTRRLDLLDAAACARAYEVVVAAESLDRPWHRAPSLKETVLAWRHDDPGERMELWQALDPDGVTVGVGTLWMGLTDNTDKVWLETAVHPDHRRRGAGRALLERLVGRTRETGRREVLLETFVPPDDPGHPHLRFAAALGFTRASTEVVRHLALPVDPARLDRLERQARAQWEADYRVETHVDGVPSDRQEGLCAVMNRLAVDAPSGDVDYEPESLTPERYRDNLRLLGEQGRVTVTTLAVHEGTGSVVAYTDVVLPAEPNPVVWQWGTLVDAGHRGHRLGVATKVANLRRLAADHPGRETVVTSNDDTNRWMVEVNLALGFEVVELLPALRRVLG